MTSRKSTLIEKISDHLQTRDKQTNFGECRRCEKKVYWSTSKVASHVRSGHCAGATEEEVQRFKEDFVYESPKNLVHRSTVTKHFKDSFDIEENDQDKSIKKESAHSKRRKIDVKYNQVQEDTTEYEDIEYDHISDPTAQEECDKIEEYLIFTEEDGTEQREVLKIEKSVASKEKPATESLTKEEKFIQAVYPQFKGRTKLQLIEDILDLKRRNELLQVKAKTYENTINRLLQ